ncbi:asparagine synthetase B [Candidatus Bathyarchaeota archaeon]|nr:asparagine synthetase B [Candidatus Bathyarchaeota archaeon]
MGTTIAMLNKQNGNTTLSPQYEQRCVSSGDAKLVFDGRIYAPTSYTSDIEAIINKLQQSDRFKASEAFLGEVEGDFAFIIAEPERIIAGRDPVGVQPLYYGENQSIVAFGSNRKALWNLGINEVYSFPPGQVGLVSRKGFEFKPVKTLVYSEPKQVTMQEAAEKLQELLEQAVRSRVAGVEDVAVAFSGGLDSSVVAFLTKKCQVNVHLIHVSLENQPETEEAKKAADALGLPLQVHLFREEDVENVVPKVVKVIEEADPVKTSIAVPFYWAAEKTAASGFNVMLAGQGADELFGGYQRYVNEYLLHGEEKVRKTMFDDVVGIHESNLERDMKICSFHNVELRVPFGSYQIAEFAMALPVELKIERRADTLRKLVLRKTAENMGLPLSVTEKTKKAVQYSTGINNALKKIAKKQKATLAEYVKKLFLDQTNQK